MLQGGSKGINEYSVVEADKFGLIKERVERIHHIFDEPALVEKYIAGKDGNELSVPILVSYNGTITNLPIVEIDLSKIPASQGKFLFITHDIKLKGRYRKIPADLPPDTIKRIHSDVARIVQAIGCKDLTRVDIRVDSTELYYVEVNVNPDKRMVNSSIIMSAYSLGLEYPEILAFIPYQAMLKYGLKIPRKMEELVRSVMALSKPTQL